MSCLGITYESKHIVNALKNEFVPSIEKVISLDEFKELPSVQSFGFEITSFQQFFDVLPFNKWNSIVKGFEIIGLIFSGRNQKIKCKKDEEENEKKKSPDPIKDRNFDIYAIFHKKGKYDWQTLKVNQNSSSGNDQTNKIPESKNFKYPTDGTLRDSKDPIREPNDKLKNFNYEFWNKKIEFVLFYKTELDALLMDSDTVTISGAQVNYGVGVYDFSNDNTLSNSTLFSTLKAESQFIGIAPDYTPHVSLAAPCPPIWGKQSPDWREFLYKFLIELRGAEYVKNNFDRTKIIGS